ncbi:hypothetical protein QE152_g37176 [Popillia japonica]|uniref:Uncharacterized protein n=1 Tax=Popillia japonica TaxID=7064 RepID=A0AAW1IBC7_POPJA
MSLRCSENAGNKHFTQKVLTFLSRFLGHSAHLALVLLKSKPFLTEKPNIYFTTTKTKSYLNSNGGDWSPRKYQYIKNNNYPLQVHAGY